jgi:hypothetical protein
MRETTEYSRISCLIDMNVVPFVNEALEDLGIPEVFVQRSKQVGLLDRSAWFGLRPPTRTEEARASVYRFYVPPRFEEGVMRRIAEAADLFLPGHGSVFAETAQLSRSSPLEFDEERLEHRCGSPEKSAVPENYAMLSCVVQRGMASALAETVLDMGLCVPSVSFGRGLGLRDRLGLLRVTIPVEKEVVYFLVPRTDVELLEGIIVRKGRLDLPGQGFIFRRYVRALTVNVRVRRGKRRQNAATMDQVVAAMDAVQGSSNWRRVDTRRPSRAAAAKTDSFVCLCLITDEGSADAFGKAAMDAGANGATLVPLECRSYNAEQEVRVASRARESIDLVIPKAVQEAVLERLETEGLFESEAAGILGVIDVQKATTDAGRAQKPSLFGNFHFPSRKR